MGLGKTTLAKQLRDKLKKEYCSDKIAIIGQGSIRRKILDKRGINQELDNINLIEMTVKFYLTSGYIAIIEGMSSREGYIEMFQVLIGYS